MSEIEKTTDTQEVSLTVEQLQAEISQLHEELKLQKARTANSVYEFEKTKERLEREVENTKKFILEKFAKDLLESVDNLERALAAVTEEDAVRQGLELTLKSLLKTLEQYHITEVNVSNGFDAQLHQAVGTDPNTPAGQIAKVLQKGYTLSDRLLRPAMVLVGQ